MEIECSAVLADGHDGQLPRGPTSIGPHVNLWMLCTACFLCINTDFVGSTNIINIWLIFINIYIFIPVSGCVGRSPSALLCSWAYSVVKMALLEWTYVLFCFKNSETINWNLLKHKSTCNCIKKFSITMKNSGNIQKYFAYTSEVLLLCGKIGMLPCI